MKRCSALALLLFLAAAPADAAQAALTLDRVFSDHMVIQRNQPIRVWGFADPAERIAVRIASQTGAGLADSSGRWIVELAPLAAGGPYELEVFDSTGSLRLVDVLVGEVWLCAGQSNMRWPLARCASAATAIPEAEVPQLRLFDMVGAAHPSATAWDDDVLERCTPSDFYLDTEWRVCTPESAASFSGVAYFFGRELQQRLGVPVGLVHNAIGGTCVEAYISREGLLGNELLAGAVTDPEAWFDNPHVPAWCRQRARQNLAGWFEAPEGDMPGHPFQPSFLFEAGIRPLSQLGLAGVVWYQGESNATLADMATPADPAVCRAGIETLISAWRDAFGRPELPFLQVQLPGMGRPWMEFREVQRQCLEISNTGLAVTIDLGNPNDVHPRNKREVGRRLALVAGAQMYGEDELGARSPNPSGYDTRGRELVLSFSDPAGDLYTGDGEPVRGFELIGGAGEWWPAAARLQGEQVVVWSPDVPSPLAVRYAWAPVPDGNLVGGTGLPVTPFLEGNPPPSRQSQDVGPRQTSFEEVPPGPFTDVETRVGRWTAAEGHAVIDAAHQKSGSQCLHIVGGEERRVVLDLDLEAGDEEVSEITFWAERWTRRDPFVFRIESFSEGLWREIYAGDDEVVIGTFATHVRVPVSAHVERLRITCSSPSGVLIDDLRFGRAAPMEIVSVYTEQPATPCLQGNPENPVALVRIETVGGLEPLAVSELRVNLRGTTDLDDVATVEILGEEGESLGDAQIAAGELSFRGRLPLVEGTNTLRISFSLSPNADLDHVVDAGCDSVRFSDDAVVEPAVANPPGTQRLGIALRNAGDDGAAVYRIPGLATTPAGTLIAVYDVRWKGGGDLPGDIDVGMSRSIDGGRSWEPMRVILDMGRDPEFRFDGVGDPAVLVDDETGTIWVAATWSHGNRSWNGSGPGLSPAETGQLMLVRSDDDGLTWSAPINITEQVKKPEWCFLLQGPGRGISMRDGTLVFPAQYQDTPENGRTPHSTILYSPDHGETWHLGTGAKPNTTESQVVELEDGVLMLNMRDNRRGSRSVYTTRDLGHTWQEHPTSRKALIEPVCNAGLLHAGGSTLLFVNPAVPRPPRRRMTLKASTDLGMTWPAENQLLLDEGQSAGYPSLSMIDESTVGILFEGSRAHMTFMRVPLRALIH